jgi:hypothetical protein
LCRGKSWECGANSDGEHQETSSNLQHLLLLGKRVAQRRGEALRDRTGSRCGFTSFAQLFECQELERLHGKWNRVFGMWQKQPACGCFDGTY